MSTINIKRLICAAVMWAIIPAISFANRQGFAAIKKYDGPGVICCTDTLAPSVNKEDQLPEPKKIAEVKKVPKSRRQVKPVPLPGIKPIIKPKIIKPVVTVGI